MWFVCNWKYKPKCIHKLRLVSIFAQQSICFKPVLPSERLSTEEPLEREKTTERESEVVKMEGDWSYTSMAMAYCNNDWVQHVATIKSLLLQCTIAILVYGALHVTMIAKPARGTKGMAKKRKSKDHKEVYSQEK